ncbi:hypothetical protein [Aeromonas veronii]|uniref:hypothetical protein n=1 Tax=Aeromonas veronii TaxID=654 RepID=UPI0018F25B32|nr:hypothetical protein [Aeromonas veronii]MBJ7592004.1 hypothetical protein [Aeromonas veronii]
MAKSKSGEVDGYRWHVSREKALGGWSQTNYHVVSPDGELFCDNFTEGPLKDGVAYCMDAISAHKEGEYSSI